jgi:hypothetical protein
MTAPRGRFGPGSASSSARVQGWRGRESTSSVGPSSTTRPRSMTSVRQVAWRTTARLWLMSSSARPRRSRASSTRFSTCACTETSSAEVGSSAMRMSGRVMSARAMARRWRWPPENWCG